LIRRLLAHAAHDLESRQRHLDLEPVGKKIDNSDSDEHCLEYPAIGRLANFGKAVSAAFAAIRTLSSRALRNVVAGNGHGRLDLPFRVSFAAYPVMSADGRRDEQPKMSFRVTESAFVTLVEFHEHGLAPARELQGSSWT
jgi:hypothetical protein